MLSIQEQPWEGEKEIIVVDDGSNDQTVSVALRLGCTVISQDRKRAAHARNQGIRHACGDWIFLLDADDVSCPGSINKLRSSFYEDPDVVAAFGKVRDFISPEISPEDLGSVSPRTEAYYGVLPGCSLIKKEVFDRIGLFDETLKSGETVDWQMKLRNSGLKTIQIEDVVLKRRIHMTNTGRTNRGEELKNYALLLRKRMKHS